MFITKTNILMNKVISHIRYIYIESPFLKKKIGYKLFTMHLYFNSTQCYPTLDKTLGMQLSLHLKWFIIRLYSCNINPHLANLWFLFCILLINMTALWSVNTTNGWNAHHNCFKENNKASHFVFKVLRQKCNSAHLCQLFWSKTAQTPTSLATTVNCYSSEKLCVVTYHSCLFFLFVGVFAI
jgi:hypothetical protein